MSLSLLIDMNLSPDWVNELSALGWSCVHWSSVGDPKAADREIMDWALANNHVVFTHDLDFGTLLALTHALGPSVIQVRAKNVLPDQMLSVVVAALTQFESELAAGALLVVDQAKSRVRILPISK
jgi:predicted nuclease of predicted toxin-antitoxin system